MLIQLLLGIWDTAGSERYESMTKNYYRGADGAVLCFDLTEPESWEKVRTRIFSAMMLLTRCPAQVLGQRAAISQ